MRGGVGKIVADVRIGSSRMVHIHSRVMATNTDEKEQWLERCNTFDNKFCDAWLRTHESCFEMLVSQGIRFRFLPIKMILPPSSP